MRLERSLNVKSNIELLPDLILMDGPLNNAVGEWIDKEYRDAIYVNTLDPEIETDERFGQPHESYKCIRVAGTNGKGSTTRMIAWSLQEEGYDVGLMSNVSTTKTLTDTIKYNDRKIPKAELKNLCREVNSVSHEDIEPYGIRTIAGLEWFRRKGIDVAVLESGVGSRYDATNIVSPEVYSITNIGRDHIESFGGDQESIVEDFALGGSKADKIVTNAEERNVNRIKEASEKNVSVAPRRATFQGMNKDLTYNCLIQDSMVKTSIRSSYQEENLNTSLEALERCSLEVSRKSIDKMLSNFRFEGRAELIEGDSDILLDGAHNLDGISALKKTLSETDRDVTAVFTALEDKPWRSMIEELSSECDELILTEPQGGKRDSHKHRLKERSERYVSDPLKAVRTAEEYAEDDSLIVVTGSLYMIREIRGKLVR